MDWDGCDDYCQIEPGFVCPNIHVCSYKDHIDLDIFDLWRDPISNTIKIYVKVWPPLNVFKK